MGDRSYRKYRVILTMREHKPRDAADKGQPGSQEGSPHDGVVGEFPMPETPQGMSPFLDPIGTPLGSLFRRF